MIAGICIGSTAFVMGFMEDHLVEINQHIMSYIIEHSGKDSREDNLSYVWAPYL